MGYTWTDGELITATKLNNTGGGDTGLIEYDINSGELNKTYNELLAMLNDGIIPHYVYVFEDSPNIDTYCYTLTHLYTNGSNSYIAQFLSWSGGGSMVDSFVSSTADGTLVYD